MFEQCLYFNSNALVRQLNRIWDEAFSDTGLSAPHGYLLRTICHNEGLSQKEISIELQLDKSTVTRFANVLINKKLIRRSASDDGRENRLYPTANGKKLGIKLDDIGKQLYSNMKKKLGSQRFGGLVKELRKALELIN